MCGDYLYEATSSGFVKNEIFTRLKELSRKNCIVAVQKCAEVNTSADWDATALSERLDDLGKSFATTTLFDIT